MSIFVGTSSAECVDQRNVTFAGCLKQWCHLMVGSDVLYNFEQGHNYTVVVYVGARMLLVSMGIKQITFIIHHLECHLISALAYSSSCLRHAITNKYDIAKCFCFDAPLNPGFLEI